MANGQQFGPIMSYIRPAFGSADIADGVSQNPDGSRTSWIITPSGSRIPIATTPAPRTGAISSPRHANVSKLFAESLSPITCGAEDSGGIGAAVRRNDLAEQVHETFFRARKTGYIGQNSYEAVSERPDPMITRALRPVQLRALTTREQMIAAAVPVPTPGEGTPQGSE
jgi:hypothetical protein